MPEISVIVPVYKAEAYFRSCVDSILGQTFADFEVILVDDGSPDNCGSICEDYAQRDSRVRVFHQDNQGQAAARNHGLSLAQSDWICFVDSDDLIHPQMLELLHQAVQNSGAPISMCQMLEAVEPPESFFSQRDGTFSIVSMDEETLVRLHDADAYPGWVACAKLLRRDIVEIHRFREGRVYEDNEAVCHWLYAAERIAQIPHALYFYRTNQESTTKSKFSLKKLDYLWALEEIIRFFTSIGYTRLRERFVERYIQAAASCFHGATYALARPEIARGVEISVWKFLKQEKIHLTRGQFECLMDTAHPKLIRLYWPLAGGVRTLKKDGVPGLLGKLRRHLGKGDGHDS